MEGQSQQVPIRLPSPPPPRDMQPLPLSATAPEGCLCHSCAARAHTAQAPGAHSSHSLGVDVRGVIL